MGFECSQRLSRRFWRNSFSVFRCIVIVWNLLMNGVDNLLFKSRSENLRLVVINHRIPTFVTSLFENPFTGNVTGRVVGIGIYPKTLTIEFGFESQRIIHHHLTGQEDHGELRSEDPGLNRILNSGRQRFATVQPIQIDLRMIPHCSRLLGPGFPLLMRSGFVKVQPNTFQLCFRKVGKRLQWSAKEFSNLLGNQLTLRASHIKLVPDNARIGIRIRAATD